MTARNQEALRFTHQALRALFTYEPETGRLRRIKTEPGLKAYPLYPKIDGKPMRLRLAVWLWHHPEAPDFIVPVDGDMENTRIENLRGESSSEKTLRVFKNKVRDGNTAGLKYIHFRRDRQASPWLVRINVKGEEIYIGAYPSRGEAIAARDRALEHYGKRGDA